MRFGPVELDVISLEGPAPSPELLSALATQIEAGAVRLVDLVLVSKSEAGDITIDEIADEEFARAGLELVASGLTGLEDVEELAVHLEPGRSAIIVALELLWARDLARQLAEDGSVVVATERIPARVVNAIAELGSDD